MYKQGISDFKYFVGIDNLDQIATEEDSVCVLNILGGESRTVSPVSHSYSGGNIVFGTSPGKKGKVLETEAGNIPVFNNVREGLDAGHAFNTGVVYLPPAGVRDGVAELIRVNPKLEKIVIITEKVAIHDARDIRAMSQQAGVTVFGANCLGIADAWQGVRIGGALGGDAPAESLAKGSVAIYSNSGNFTTTIAQYLKTEGWGTTTSVSSGKDVYIHFALPEFVYALANDTRSKAAVMYVEPGGYYEHGLEFTKPTIACVVGRWKAKLSRPVGHAGALGGDGDDAKAKEDWFKQALDVSDIYTPDNPVVSAKGAVVTNIAHIPLALSQVMALNGLSPDFEPRGNLSLKAWFASNQGLTLPEPLDIAVEQAISPYDEQINALSRQVGRNYRREGMKDASGVSRMNPQTQITSLHNRSILELARQPMESNLGFALLGETVSDNAQRIINTLIACQVNLHGEPAMAAAEASRCSGNSPNLVLSAALSCLGPNRIAACRNQVELLIGLFAHTKLDDAEEENVDLTNIAIDDALIQQFCHPLGEDSLERHRTKAIIQAIEDRQISSVFVTFLQRLPESPNQDALIAALALTVVWQPLMRKRISKTTAINFPWYLNIYATLIGASASAGKHQEDEFGGQSTQELMSHWSVGEIAYLALTGQKADADTRFNFELLVGLLLTNGPGSISAQGCKGAVSADGPQTPERILLNKAFIGFLTHTGFSHGGAGFEGIEFLIECLADTDLSDPGSTDSSSVHQSVNVRGLAANYAKLYKQLKTAAKDSGGPKAPTIPGVSHPVFKGKAVNQDPREQFIKALLHERGVRNLFHEFYSHLVEELANVGATSNQFCVNIDAVISAELLKMLWKPFKSGDYSKRDLEDAAFTTFLYGRMIGCAAEIDDHLNRGRNMDTRTPASQLRSVS